MKAGKTKVLLVVIMAALVLGAGFLVYKNEAVAPKATGAIVPVGQQVATDAYGNAIYQIEANGIKIGYKLQGSGEPLIMIMGLGGTMEGWPQELLNILGQKYQIILMDNRGMGYSTADDTTFTYPLFASDVWAVLNSLGVAKTNVLGYSMGSTITQELLLEHPEKINKAVIYATTVDGSNVTGNFEKAGATTTDPIVLRQVAAANTWKSPLDKMALIANQVMFIVATGDTTVYPQSSKTLAETIPGAWLVQFKNGSHALMREVPMEFGRVVLNFFQTDATVPVATK